MSAPAPEVNAIGALLLVSVLIPIPSDEPKMASKPIERWILISNGTPKAIAAGITCPVWLFFSLESPAAMSPYHLSTSILEQAQALLVDFFSRWT